MPHSTNEQTTISHRFSFMNIGHTIISVRAYNWMTSGKIECFTFSTLRRQRTCTSFFAQPFFLSILFFYCFLNITICSFALKFIIKISTKKKTGFISFPTLQCKWNSFYGSRQNCPILYSVALLFLNQFSSAQISFAKLKYETIKTNNNNNIMSK